MVATGWDTPVWIESFEAPPETERTRAHSRVLAARAMAIGWDFAGLAILIGWEIWLVRRWAKDFWFGASLGGRLQAARVVIRLAH